MAHRHRLPATAPFAAIFAANIAHITHTDHLAALDDTGTTIAPAESLPVYVEITTPVDRGPPPPADPHVTLTLAPNAPNGPARGNRHAH